MGRLAGIDIHPRNAPIWFREWFGPAMSALSLSANHQWAAWDQAPCFNSGIDRMRCLLTRVGCAGQPCHATSAVALVVVHRLLAMNLFVFGCLRFSTAWANRPSLVQDSMGSMQVFMDKAKDLWALPSWSCCTGPRLEHLNTHASL